MSAELKLMTAAAESSKAWIIISRLVVVSVFWMILVGGMVTSKDAGMAVPDWPLSFGSLNPPGWWEEELVALEHGHRLFGALTGIFVIALLVTMYLTPKARPYLWLGWIAMVGVVVQGFLGGYRVRLETAGFIELATLLRILHGFLAQAYFCLVLGIAVLAKQPRYEPSERSEDRRLLVPLCGLMAALFIQLILGATMRHHGWGLAIPDFPLSNGQWVPAFTSLPVVLAFAHRAWAFVILAGILWLASQVFLSEQQGKRSRSLAGWMTGLVFVQVLLGASVIWMKEAPIPTTFHVLNGALLLGVTFVFLMRALLAKRDGDPESANPENVQSELERAHA